MDFSDFINSSPQPLLAIDCAQGSVLAVNPAAEKLLGFTAPVITGAGDAAALFVTHYDRWIDLCRRLMVNRGRCSAHMLLRNAAGKSFPALLEGVAFVGQGRQEGMLCIHADESDVSVPGRLGRDEVDAGEDPHYGLVTVREDGSIVSINRRGLRMLGYKRFRDLLENASVLGRLYEGSNVALGMSGLAMDFGRGIERDLRRCDGGRLRVYETCRRLHGPEGPGLYELRWLDIDHYRLMAEEYALCQEKYRVLVEHSQDGVFITHEGLYVYVNSTYAHMLGRTVDEMIGRPFMEFIDPEDRPRMAMMWHEREAGRWEKNSYEIRLLHRNPEQRVLASVRSGLCNSLSVNFRLGRHDAWVRGLRLR